MSASTEADVLPFDATVPAVLRQRVREGGQAPLILQAEKVLTYGEAERRSRILGAGLLAQGVSKGTRVAILFPNGIDFVVCFLAAARIGAVVTPINTFSKAAELAHQLRHSDAEVLIATPSFLANDYLVRLEEAFPNLVCQVPGKLRLTDAPYLRAVFVAGQQVPRWAEPVQQLEAMGVDIDDRLVDAIEQQVTASDWLCILYTSGSSAEPKGVIHSHGAMIRRTASIARATHILAGDVVYNPSPFFWLGGFGNLVGIVATGAALMTEDRFEPGPTMDFMERAGCTIALGWPHFAASMRDHPSFSARDFSRIKGGNLRSALRNEPIAADPSLIAGGIGMTETAGQHTYHLDEPLPERLRGAFGVPAPGMELRIVDPETGRELPDGEEGELQVRGYALMQGYYKKEREETFQPDGFFRTGDLGMVSEGLFFFRGRLNDMVKTSGANVSPAEVRRAAIAIPGVRECFVTGLDDPTRGQIVAAAIVPEPGAALEVGAITAALKQALSSYKVPRVIRFVKAEEVPMLATAKLDRRALVALLQQSLTLDNL